MSSHDALCPALSQHAQVMGEGLQEAYPFCSSLKWVHMPFLEKCSATENTQGLLKCLSSLVNPNLGN